MPTIVLFAVEPTDAESSISPKVEGIKAVRTLGGYSLATAKELVDKQVMVKRHEDVVPTIGLSIDFHIKSSTIDAVELLVNSKACFELHVEDIGVLRGHESVSSWIKREREKLTMASSELGDLIRNQIALNEVTKVEDKRFQFRADLLNRIANSVEDNEMVAAQEAVKILRLAEDYGFA